MQQSDYIKVEDIEKAFEESTKAQTEEFLLSIEHDAIQVEYFSFIFSSRVKNGVEPYAEYSEKLKVLKEALISYIDEMKARNKDADLIEDTYLHFYRGKNDISIDIGWGNRKNVWKRIPMKNDMEFPALVYASIQGIAKTMYYFCTAAPNDIQQKCLIIN